MSEQQNPMLDATLGINKILRQHLISKGILPPTNEEEYKLYNPLNTTIDDSETYQRLKDLMRIIFPHNPGLGLKPGSKVVVEVFGNAISTGIKYKEYITMLVVEMVDEDTLEVMDAEGRHLKVYQVEGKAGWHHQDQNLNYMPKIKN